MNACNLSLSGMDVGACLGQLFSGLVPDWLGPLLPYWPWAAVILVLGIAYRLAGVPGLAAAAGAIGYILGRRSKAVETDEIWPDPDKPVKPKKKRPTLFGK